MIKRKRVFVQNTDSGEPAYFAGTIGQDDAEVGIRNLVAGECCDLLGGHIDSINVTIFVMEMTDEEVAAIPDC